MNLDKHRERFFRGCIATLLIALGVFFVTMVSIGVEWVLNHAAILSKYVSTIVGGLLLVYVIGCIDQFLSE